MHVYVCGGGGVYKGVKGKDCQDYIENGYERWNSYSDHRKFEVSYQVALKKEIIITIIMSIEHVYMPGIAEYFIWSLIHF